MTNDTKHLTDREKKQAAKLAAQLAKIDARRAKRQARAESADYRMLERTASGLDSIALMDLTDDQARAIGNAREAVTELMAPFLEAKDDKTPALPFEEKEV